MATIDFFLASPSGGGFFSLFPEVARLSDKSTVNILCTSGAARQKALADVIAGAPENAVVERIHCARNSDTLDGVIIHLDGKSAVTAAAGKMHKLYPDYPGVGENIIVISDKDTNRAAELSKHMEMANGLAQAQGFLHAAARFDIDTRKIVARDVDFPKLDKAAGKLAAALFGSRKGCGGINRRLISAITKDGVRTLDTAFTYFCEEVYVIKDDYGVVADRLCRIIAVKAIKAGEEVYACFNPLNPEFIDHLILPGKKLGFIRQTKEWETDFYPFRVISQRRFTDIAPESKVQISFNKKVKDEMLNTAITKL